MSFKDNSVRRNLFLSASSCRHSRLSLREMDEKFKFGGTIGYGDSYLEFLFRHFKVFTLHAIFHDVAGVVRVQKWRRSRLLLLYWARTIIMFARSRDWTTFLPLRKTLFSAFHFQLCRLLKQCLALC